MEQQIGTPTQQKWISKLIGYEFTMTFRANRENKVVDALSQVAQNEKLVYTIIVTQLETSWVQRVQKAYRKIPN